MNNTLKLGAVLVLVVALVVVFPVGDWIEAGAAWAQGQGTTGLLVFAALYAGRDRVRGPRIGAHP